MTTNEMLSMIETMNNYDDLAAKAKEKADAIRTALKDEMLRLDTEELAAGAYIVRYTNVISNRFDSIIRDALIEFVLFAIDGYFGFSVAERSDLFRLKFIGVGNFVNLPVRCLQNQRIIFHTE